MMSSICAGFWSKVQTMNRKPPEGVWRLATWEGSRREQLRRALRLTLRERLQLLDDMGDLVRHFAWMRRTGKFRSSGDESGV